MVQIIPPKLQSPFGQAATGFAEGANKTLSEQLPKYIQQGLLSQGLRNLSQKKDLSPMEYMTELSAIPGAAQNPALLQSFSKLYREQLKRQGLQQPQARPSPFQGVQPTSNDQGSASPSLTTPEVFEKTQEGFIPPTKEEEIAIAGEAFNKNPELFENDPQKAIQWAAENTKREMNIAEAYERKHGRLTTLQDNVVNRLKKFSDTLGVKVPANTYSKIEDEAIQSTKPKKEGGQGLTEQQAMKKYGEKLDEVSRDYEAINTIGNWGITTRKPSETARSIESLQTKFKERGDVENFADKLISTNKLSAPYAYSKANPTKDYRGLDSKLRSIPNLETTETMFETVKDPNSKVKTYEISKSLAPFLKEGASPLAIAFELDKKGYDSSSWLDYLKDHREELGLSESQGREIDKPKNLFGTINDWWLQTFSE